VKQTFLDPDDSSSSSKRTKKDDYRSSKDAYMLVYQKKGFIPVAKEAPDTLMERVKSDNSVLGMELNIRAHK
jgi:hypothetical protein